MSDASDDADGSDDSDSADSHDTQDSTPITRVREQKSRAVGEGAPSLAGVKFLLLGIQLTLVGGFVDALWWLVFLGAAVGLIGVFE